MTDTQTRCACADAVSSQSHPDHSSVCRRLKLTRYRLCQFLRSHSSTWTFHSHFDRQARLAHPVVLPDLDHSTQSMLKALYRKFCKHHLSRYNCPSPPEHRNQYRKPRNIVFWPDNEPVSVDKQTSTPVKSCIPEPKKHRISKD